MYNLISPSSCFFATIVVDIHMYEKQEVIAPPFDTICDLSVEFEDCTVGHTDRIIVYYIRDIITVSFDVCYR